MTVWVGKLRSQRVIPGNSQAIALSGQLPSQEGLSVRIGSASIESGDARHGEARLIPSGVLAEAKVIALSKSGGAGRQGPALKLLGCQHTWRPARRFLSQGLPHFPAAQGSAD